MSRTLLLVVLVSVLFCSAVSCAEESLLVDDFEGDLSHWQVQRFVDQTRYELVADGSSRVLHATSSAAASGLIKELEFDLNRYPRLQWRWKIESVLTTGDARTKGGDDYAARVYVIFPHWIKPLTRTINYIWANRLPQEEALPNSFFSRAMMLAVESGNQRAGEWILEERNLVEDYRRLFGEEPPLAGAIAIMTDTDNTGEKTQAWYDDIRLLSAP